jgi:serine/threonine-protein kinase
LHERRQILQGHPASSTFLAMGSVPRDTEEGRAFLQSRISGFGKLGFTLAVVFYVSSTLLIGFLRLDGELTPRLLIRGFASAMLIQMVVFSAEWLSTRRVARTIGWLYLADAATTLAVCGSTAAGMWWINPHARPEVVAILQVTNLLAIRAVMIPSSATRSGWLAVGSVAPSVVLTYFYYATHPFAKSPTTPFGYACIAALLSSPAVIVSTYVSRIIYGLTQQVREATQLGQYTLDEKIGEGGMGVVFKARHSMLRRPTAVKLLPPSRAGEHNLIRFEREVQLTSLLTHPNTIAIYDFGRTPDGVFYYAMEYLEGIDLEDLVEQAGPLDPARCIHILMQVTGALEEAHAVGLIHRDIKPANIILCERGSTPDVAKVLDFGLVKRMEPQADDPSMSAVNTITGTPLYLSPEAILTPDKVDARSDLYALGCVGYYLLTGSNVFNGGTVVETCGQHIHTAPTPPSIRLGRSLPPKLEALVMRCLEKAPDRRPADATELFESFAQCEDAKNWDATSARQWWRDRGREIRKRLREQPAVITPSSRPRTLAVDMRTRASHG